jgi:glucose/arabinose dehydrogenase
LRQLVAALLLTAFGALPTGSATLAPAPPAITEPAADGQVISPFDVHMVAGPFAGSPDETHVCSDWEIRTINSDTVVWTAPCAVGSQKVHIHLGDGEFVGFLAGRHQLNSGSDYRLRVRFQGDANGGEWSEWAERVFRTSSPTVIPALVLSDVASIAAPRWRDDAGVDIALPAGEPAPALRLEVAGETVLEWTDTDAAPVNPAGLSVHAPLRVIFEAGGGPASLPASRVTFTDGSGQDREAFLPPISLEAGETAAWWIAASGGAFTDPTGGDPAAQADFSSPVSAPPVPWAVQQPGFRVERFATDFQLPVNIAFIPNPEAGPDAPLFYVTELYGTIKVVTRAGQVHDYATNLLNYDPTGGFPGSGEKGLTGIVVEPESGDVFASMLYAIPPATDVHFPKVVRLQSSDAGATASSQTTILEFPSEPLGASHQISNLSIGPDGKLYVHIGDGFQTEAAQDLESVRGKILRVDQDGAAPPDNPHYDGADGLSAADLVFASGLRNPFGGAWRAADGALWEVENGPGVDRLARVVAGRNFGWDGSNASMTTFAAYNWPISAAPVNIAFVQPSTFAGSGFPPDKMDHTFVTESGPTYALGPQLLGKRISEFVFDLDGNRISGPVPLIEYAGAGRATATALAAGPDGLYFADLYKDFGASSPIDRGANVFRVRWTGIADFAATASEGDPPLVVEFLDSSNIPSPTAWHWEFGDGATSDEQNPVHTYLAPGAYDVRLTVTGSGGPTVRQKPGYVVVGRAARVLESGPPHPRPIPRVVGVRP